MTYVIAQPCVDVMDKSCTQVCPVACIHPAEGDPMHGRVSHLYIDPEGCIDCDACAVACPVSAIYPLEQLPPEWSQYAADAENYFAEHG